MLVSKESAKSGEILTLTVEDLSRGGAGVCRDETGRVVFVPLTAPGDRLRVRISRADRRYAQGEILEILDPSPQRVTPRCALFGRCGGCQWQHLPYELQWKTKVSGVRHALSRVAVPPPEQYDELPADHPWNYRNRVQLRGFRDQLGFFAPASQDLVPASGCPIARREINDSWGETLEQGRQHSRPYKVEVEVLANGEIRRSWNAAHAAGGFRQIFDEQNEKLRAWVGKAITPGRPVLDLFGGGGNLSLFLSTIAQQIDCVDVSSPNPAPKDTPRNYHFHRAAALPWLLRKKQEKRPSVPSSAIIDPPREGLGPAFAEIHSCLRSLGVDEIVMVGCEPDAWARDLARFRSCGWNIERAAVLDFFPQTPHVESVALIRV